MIIKKIYIKNFKGIRDKKIIDFSNQTALLIGPNGFGKTTIFDILELCLTGKISRTLKNDGVTNHSSDYNKPFYQNTKGEDVIIKIWLEIDEESFIITKFLPKDNDGRLSGRGRRNKPDEFELLGTYIDQPKNFENDIFIIDNNQIGQGDIDEFFKLDEEGIKLAEVYNLFNYVQQEETTFFLEKSERDRKNSLGFLFNTSDCEKNLDEISEVISKFKIIQSSLSEKITNISKLSNLENIKYIKVFKNKDFEFDKEDLFKECELDSCNELNIKYINDIDKLMEFINIFSPKEYEKKSKINILNYIIENKDFQDYCVLSNF